MLCQRIEFETLILIRGNNILIRGNVISSANDIANSTGQDPYSYNVIMSLVIEYTNLQERDINMQEQDSDSWGRTLGTRL